MLLRALIAVKAEALADRLHNAMSDNTVRAEKLASGEDAWDRLTREEFDLFLLNRDGLGNEPRALLRNIGKLPSHPGVVVVAAREDPTDRAHLLAAGCLAVLWEGLPVSTLKETLRALAKRRREERLQHLKAERPEERYSLKDFVAESGEMRRFMETVRQVAQSDTTSVLILGETGVGKERLARAIHAEGRRGAGPFIAVNCGALPEPLLESELFGHEEGAFTGAVRARRGYFELAHGGTLFLDEIGEMAPHLQVKLLRVLEEKSFYRVGGERATVVDVRIVAATNRDLRADVANRRFRSDLYYRLAVVTLAIPPLRGRREDVPQLVTSYLEHFKTQLNRRDLSIDPDAMHALVGYDWPGNVRELINVLERAVLLCRGSRISVTDFPPEISRVSGTSNSDGGEPAFPDAWLAEPLDDGRRRLMLAYEQRYLRRLLRESHGRIGKAASRAGITERTLYDLMKKHRLRKEDFKPAPTG
ncbi:MAG TPA: sigma-54 dependent transcriptional regulator [Vicinamibacteria bacterium]|nr:sigma-54 dependent transcriptional regulator [Vicinamibacteria bacterium]